jgi:hypothetical protein
MNRNRIMKKYDNLFAANQQITIKNFLVMKSCDTYEKIYKKLFCLKT